MTTPPPVPPVALPNAQALTLDPVPPVQVAEDLPCRKCGYNLRGLASDGRCPECGTPVGLSFHGDLLRYSDPQWLGTLRRGTVLLLFAVLAAMLATVAAMFGGILAGTVGATLGSLLGSVVSFVLNLWGTWLLTAPDPSGIGEDRYGTSRRIIRVSVIVSAGSYLLNPIQEAVPAETRVVVAVLSTLASIVYIVGLFAFLSYLSKLALRIPDDTLASRTRVLMYGLGISYGLGVLFGLVVLLMEGPGPVAPGAWFAVAGCAVGLAVFAFVIMYVFMLFRFKNHLREQADLARQPWAAAAPPIT